MCEPPIGACKRIANGVEIPCPGLGTYLIEKSDIGGGNVIKNAIECGWRHIDNAKVYSNEEIVGAAVNECISKCIVSRENLFVASKVAVPGYFSTIECCKHSLKIMGLEYFDLYLLHIPFRREVDWQKCVIDTWCAMQTLYEAGLVRAIGVSNFSIHHLEYLNTNASIKPMVHQIEVHPQHQQREVVRWSESHAMVVEAWSALNQGRIFSNSVFRALSEKYQRPIAQIALRWSIQKGFVPLAMSHICERNQENLRVFDFVLNDDDMQTLDMLDGGVFSGWHQDTQKPIPMVPVSELCKVPTAKLYSKEISTYNVFGLPIWRENFESSGKKKYYLFGRIRVMTKNVVREK